MTKLAKSFESVEISSLFNNDLYSDKAEFFLEDCLNRIFETFVKIDLISSFGAFDLINHFGKLLVKVSDNNEVEFEISITLIIDLKISTLKLESSGMELKKFDKTDMIVAALTLLPFLFNK
ncbi:unnamed protein product [[Candida] boidinii]|nr:unnamed protein product [[Candida] boidinii]